MTIPVLYAMHYSPWSHRAKWALEHHKIDFDYREHVPFLGELALRRRTRHAGLKRRPTVPLLIASGEVLADSWDIICYADRIGSGSSLHTERSEVAHWVSRLDPAYETARRRVTQNTLRSKEALKEAAAAVVPQSLAGVSRPVAALGAQFIAKKHQFDHKATLHQDKLITGLEEIREAVGDGPFIYDSFSAADIIAASLITALRPHADLPLGPATRAVWTDEELSDRFSDLILWRDRLWTQSKSDTNE